MILGGVTQGRRAITRLIRNIGCCALPVCMILISCGKNSSPKFRQYYTHGQELYKKHCSNCHQPDGSGLGRVYPPLNKSDFMENNLEEVVCLIRFGKSGELFVNGKEYNQPMKGISSLSDLEVAEVVTYIYNTWSHERGLVEVKEVSPLLNNCQPAPSTPH